MAFSLGHPEWNTQETAGKKREEKVYCKDKVLCHFYYSFHSTDEEFLWWTGEHSHKLQTAVFQKEQISSFLIHESIGTARSQPLYASKNPVGYLHLTI